MFPRITVGLALLVGAVALAAGAAEGASVQLSSEYRYAAQTSKRFARGGAEVSESQSLTRGLRLAALGAQDNKAAATAVYLFDIPLAAKSLTIEVAYRVDAAAKDKEVAGLLFVRTEAMERKAAKAGGQAKDSVDEPASHGNLYFLKGNEPTTSVTLPAENCLINGVLEVHLVAGPGQAFDAQYVQVSAYRAFTAYSGGNTVIGGYANDPLRYPSYIYSPPLGGPLNSAPGTQIPSFDPTFLKTFLPPQPQCYIYRDRDHDSPRHRRR